VDVKEKDGGDGGKGNPKGTREQVLLNGWELRAESGMSCRFWSLSVNGRKINQF
jgi:hypothetical protein